MCFFVCMWCSSSAKMLLSGGDLNAVQELHTSLEEFQQGKSMMGKIKTNTHLEKGINRSRHSDMQTDYLVPAVSQVDPQDTHAMKDELHGGQEVIQHCGLPNNKVQRSSSSTAMFVSAEVHTFTMETFQMKILRNSIIAL